MMPGLTPVHQNQVTAWLLRFMTILVACKCSVMWLPIYEKYKDI